MLVLGVNKILEWCQILTNGRHYTCRTKDINGELHFVFKRVWYPVAEYLADSAHELVEENGKIVLRYLKK